MINKNSLISACIHLAMFIVGYIVTVIIFSHSDSKTAYAILNGFWLSTYVGYILRIEIRVSFSAYILSFILLLGLYLTGNASFYHDAPSSLNINLIIVVFIQSAIIVSPIFINALVKKFINK